jgi:hypothetical protein
VVGLPYVLLSDDLDFDLLGAAIRDLAGIDPTPRLGCLRSPAWGRAVAVSPPNLLPFASAHSRASNGLHVSREPEGSKYAIYCLLRC